MLHLQSVDSCSWLHQVDDVAIPAEIRVWDLGAGETAVLASAKATPGSIAIIEDLQGRRCAASLSIRVIGTLGVVLAARRRDVIPAARPVVDELVRTGMHLARRVVADALALVGE
jgi:predicted nucleic acid-binding protein